jgi:SulP family sulfate permease
VLVGSILAIAYSKWEQVNPNISLRGNVLKIRGNIYYGSLPVIESKYHDAIARVDNLIVDFSECYYLDPEGVRWLAAAKAAGKVGFVDRRSEHDRRAVERASAPDGVNGENRRARSGKPDRRQLSEF